MTRTDDVARRLERATADLQHALAELAELERYAPAEVAAIAGMLVAHLRAWRPESVAPLGTLGPPTEVIRDPRDAG
ncbi:MAG: hypothetical protein JNK64_20940 [Myxococcales bacterium]|nr:hypothetical protein [Myxococcales bacterium]